MNSSQTEVSMTSVGEGSEAGGGSRNARPEASMLRDRSPQTSVLKLCFFTASVAGEGTGGIGHRATNR